AHHVRDVGVGSSNLLTPTKAESLSGSAGRAFLFRSAPNAQHLSKRRNKKALPGRASERERLSAFVTPRQRSPKVIFSPDREAGETTFRFVARQMRSI